MSGFRLENDHMTTTTAMSRGDAEWVSEAIALAAGFASVNNVPHLCVELPDGHNTISVRTSDGKRITFAFIVTSWPPGGPADCVDIVYHDSGSTRSSPNGGALPTFDVIIDAGARHACHTSNRTTSPDPAMVAVLMQPVRRGAV
jgi:hypothetical protein